MVIYTNSWCIRPRIKIYLFIYETTVPIYSLRSSKKSYVLEQSIPWGTQQ